MNARSSAPYFVDTNVFVYAYDLRDKTKHKVAQDLLEDLYTDKCGTISTQVIQEFCNVMRKKRVKGLENIDVGVAIDVNLKPFLAHHPSLPFYHRVLTLLDGKSLSYYDALIVQAALDLGCTKLYSEDLQPGQKFGKLTVINPFKDPV
jgi:predicted nucleic acid-binding protein